MSCLIKLFICLSCCLLVGVVKVVVYLQELLKVCLVFVMDGISVLVILALFGVNIFLYKIIKVLDIGLGYQFYVVWGLVLQVFVVLFEVGCFYVVVFVIGSEIYYVYVQLNLDILNFMGF